MDEHALYYFLIANPLSKKEIGTYIDNSSVGNSIDDFNYIVTKSRELFRADNVLKFKDKKNKISLNNFNLYYTIMMTDTFYLAAVRKNSKYCRKENLIFELIGDIEHQGIKKLVDKQGELTNVGKQNLKFSIERYQESKTSKFSSRIFPNFLDSLKREPLIKEEDIQVTDIEQKRDKEENENTIEKSEGEIEIIDNNFKLDSKKVLSKILLILKNIFASKSIIKIIIIVIIIIFIICLILHFS